MEHGWLPVLLTAGEEKIIEQVGGSRLGVKAASGMRGEALQSIHQRGAQGQIMGYAAECALRKLLSQSFDENVSRRGNAGRHARLLFEHETPAGEAYSKEYTVNAAYVSDPTYDLRFSPDRVPEADILTLWTGTLPLMWLMGVVSRRAFLEGAEQVDLGYGVRLLFKQSRLAPPRDFVRFAVAEERAKALCNLYRTYQRIELKRHGDLFAKGA